MARFRWPSRCCMDWKYEYCPWWQQKTLSYVWWNYTDGPNNEYDVRNRWFRTGYYWMQEAFLDGPRLLRRLMTDLLSFHIRETWFSLFKWKYLFNSNLINIFMIIRFLILLFYINYSLFIFMNYNISHWMCPSILFIQFTSLHIIYTIVFIYKLMKFNNKKNMFHHSRDPT